MNTAVSQAGSSTETRAFRSPLRYPGGKQKAIDQIAHVLPSRMIEYREPMIGGGSVYFYARSQRLAKRYWINDKFKELVSFWRTAQNVETCARLCRELEELRSGFASAEDIKEYYLAARNEVPEDSYREALLFFFFNRVTFSGTTRAGGFSSSASLRRFTASAIARLAPLPFALADTRITELDFEEVITKPGRDTFIFLDPPYFTATRLYGRNGSLHSFEHDRLAQLLRATRHKFLITYDDCPEIRSLYEGCTITPWRLQYGMNNCNSKKLSKIGNEIFISNYRP
ncbi:MAG: DNA adenine methylase [Candidatus Obscuribacterales bacterium]|nr:DNA adenine methylase [Candidatus Obscuribacterales bacterium]